MAPTPLFLAFIEFTPDPSALAGAYGYRLEIPDFRLAYDDSELDQAQALREYTREVIHDFYEGTGCEGRITVKFSDELEKPAGKISMPVFSAFIEFAADPSVGVSSYGFTMEIPDIEVVYGKDEPDQAKALREHTREQIKDLYESMDGEFKATVRFSDEFVTEPPMPDFDEQGEDLAPTVALLDFKQRLTHVSILLQSVNLLVDRMQSPRNQEDADELEQAESLLNRLYLRFALERGDSPEIYSVNQTAPPIEVPEGYPLGGLSPKTSLSAIAIIRDSFNLLMESLDFTLSELDGAEVRQAIMTMNRLVIRNGMRTGDDELESIFYGGLMQAPTNLLTSREHLSVLIELMERVPLDIKLNVYSDALVRQKLRDPYTTDGELKSAAASVEQVYQSVLPVLKLPP